MRLKLATFNIENLFTRFDFSAFTDSRSEKYLPAAVQFFGDYADGDFTKFADFKRQVETAAIAQDDDRRQHTALAFAQADADIYGLQEVDSAEALARFMSAYVQKIGVDKYDQIVLHEGNDFRGIDVAAIARDIRPIYSRSHATITAGWLNETDSGKALLKAYPLAAKAKNNRRIFRRDCLELETRIQNKSGSIDKTVSIFVCHFKSMSGGRGKSMGVRQLEALTVREIINRKFAQDPDALWVVMGDLNDYRQKISIQKAQDANGNFIEKIEVLGDSAPSGVDPLLDGGFGINTLNLLPQEERWTHYYASQKHKTQLDYIIASPAMFKMVKGKPTVIRNGMPHRLLNSDDIKRFPRIGWDRPKASDHCPLVVEFDIK